LHLVVIEQVVSTILTEDGKRTRSIQRGENHASIPK
jgi:hypothetical protein